LLAATAGFSLADANIALSKEFMFLVVRSFNKIAYSHL